MRTTAADSEWRARVLSQNPASNHARTWPSHVRPCLTCTAVLECGIYASPTPAARRHDEKASESTFASEKSDSRPCSLRVSTLGRTSQRRLGICFRPSCMTDMHSQNNPAVSGVPCPNSDLSLLRILEYLYGLPHHLVPRWKLLSYHIMSILFTLGVQR